MDGERLVIEMRYIHINKHSKRIQIIALGREGVGGGRVKAGGGNGGTLGHLGVQILVIMVITISILTLCILSGWP